MNADRFAPIRLAEPGHPPQRYVATVMLEAARVQPDYEMADDVGIYSQTLPRNREALEGMLNVECPEASHG